MARDVHTPDLPSLADRAVEIFKNDFGTNSRFAYADSAKIGNGADASEQTAAKMPILQEFRSNPNRGARDASGPLGIMSFTPVDQGTGTRGPSTLFEVSTKTNHRGHEELQFRMTEVGEPLVTEHQTYALGKPQEIYAKRMVATLDAMTARFSPDAAVRIIAPRDSVFGSLAANFRGNPSNRLPFGKDIPAIVKGVATPSAEMVILTRTPDAIRRQLTQGRFPTKGVYVRTEVANTAASQYGQEVSRTTDGTVPPYVFDELKQGRVAGAAGAFARKAGRGARDNKLIATTVGVVAIGAVAGHTFLDGSDQTTVSGEVNRDPMMLPEDFDRSGVIDQTLSSTLPENPSDLVIETTVPADVAPDEPSVITTPASLELVSVLDQYGVPESNRNFAVRTGTLEQAFASDDGQYIWVEAMGERDIDGSGTLQLVRLVKVVDVNYVEPALVPYVANGLDGSGAAGDSLAPLSYDSVVLGDLRNDHPVPLSEEVSTRLKPGDLVPAYVAGADGKADLAATVPVIFDGLEGSPAFGTWWYDKFDEAGRKAALADAGIPDA